MKLLELAQKMTNDTVSEMKVSEGVEIARKNVRLTTGLSTNMEMLLNCLKPHLPAMSSEAVQVAENIQEEVRGTKRPAGTAATQKDTITRNESGWTQREMEEDETKKVRSHGPVRAFLNQGLGMAAIGLQEAMQVQTENAWEDSKENIQDVKKFD